MATERTSLEDVKGLIYSVDERLRYVTMLLAQWVHHDHDASALEAVDEARDELGPLRDAITSMYGKYYPELVEREG